MISVGDLVEWTEMSNAKRKTNKYVMATDSDAITIGIVLKHKTESLDGINKTKLFEVHFPDRQQYWIARDCLKKLA